MIPMTQPRSGKTADQREFDHIRATTDLDWAPRAGSQAQRVKPGTCLACVYREGKHTCKRGAKWPN